MSRSAERLAAALDKRTTAGVPSAHPLPDRGRRQKASLCLRRHEVLFGAPAIETRARLKPTEGRRGWAEPPQSASG